MEQKNLKPYKNKIDAMLLKTVNKNIYKSKQHNKIAEPKYDGTRIEAFYNKNGKTVLTNRHGNIVTFKYPDIVQSLKTHVKLNIKTAVFDGEAVVFDKNNKSDFQMLSRRSSMSTPKMIQEGVKKYPINYMIFDILKKNKQNLMHVPLIERKQILKQSITPDGIRSVPFTKNIKSMWNKAKTNGWEGIVVKDVNSIYEPGKRSQQWQKDKFERNIDAVILGYTHGLGKRKNQIGSLVVGAYKNNKLYVLGRVGGGWSDSDGIQLRKMLSNSKLHTKPNIQYNDLIKYKNTVWTSPKYVARIEYQEMTNDNRLRIAKYKGLRTDIKDIKRGAHL